MSHSIHDFSAKLCQPSVLPTLERYIAWRRALRVAREQGTPEPPPPDLAPISINLDLTTACNYRCTHCIDWDILNTRHRLEEEDLRASIEHMVQRGLRSVILLGGGEPTLYPGFVDLVAFLKHQGLAVAVVTNGSRGDRLDAAAQHMDGGDWIRLSLDSGSNELFAAMHRPVGELSLDEICGVAARIRRRNPRPRVGYSFIIVWKGASRDSNSLHENIHEIRLAAQRAKEAGFDYIAFKPVLERRESGAEVMDPAQAEAREREVVERISAAVRQAQALEDESFSVYVSTNLRSLQEGSWRELARQPRTCHMQALRQVLTPMGLYNCPAHRGVPKARLGNQDLYADPSGPAGPALERLLERFDAAHECREVTCLYHEVNWWLEERIAGDGAVEPGPEMGDTFL